MDLKKKKIDELKFRNLKVGIRGHKALVCFLCPNRACGFLEIDSQTIARTRNSNCTEDVVRIQRCLIRPEDADRTLLVTSVEDITIPEEML
jgi:hypothetical protein